MSKFTEYKLDITPKNEKLVNEYLKKTKAFIDDNSLEEDLYFDIEERVFEKLAEKEKLSELVIKQTLNEIGNPQDIFEVDDTKKQKQSWIQMLQAKLKKVTKNKFLLSFVIILLFAFIARPPAWVIIFAFIAWFMTWLWAGFAQYTRNNQGEISIFSSLVFIFKKIKNAIVSIFQCIKKTILFVISFVRNSMGFIISTVKKIFNLIVTVARFVFHFVSSFIWYALIALALILCFVVPIVYMWFEIWNVNYHEIIPHKLLVGYLFSLLGLISLGIYCVMKKHFLVYFIMYGSSLALAISFIFLGITELYNAHSYRGVIAESYSLETEKEDLTINKYNIDLYGNNYFSPIVVDGYDIKLRVSKDDQFTFKVINTLFSDTQESVDSFSGTLSRYVISEEQGYIDIALENGQVFNRKVDFVPLEKTLEIYIPENKTLSFNHFWYGDFGYSDLFYDCETNKFQAKGNEILCVDNASEIMDEVLEEIGIFSDQWEDTWIKNSDNVPSCDQVDGLSQCAQ